MELNEIKEDLLDIVADELGDEILDEIRASEREMIIDFLRSNEWLYECCEDAANAIEELAHYDEEELH